jgi:hypothetical protein
MSTFFPRRTGRRGPCRSRFYPSECLVLDATKLKDFFKRGALSTLIEFPGLRRSIDLTRLAEDRILLANCPPPIDQQEIELIDAPWGPNGSLRRYLLACPHCSRRVAKLLIPWSSSGFACRRCHRVAYPPPRDHLDTLLSRYDDLGRCLNKLMKLRATMKTHVVPPATSAQIDEYVRSLVAETEALRSKVRMHGGHVVA